MSDYQRAVDELRFAIQSDGEILLQVIELSDTFLGLVAAYSDLCSDCNQRLRKCDDALRQGLRSEALHLADVAPNLLDLLGVLDFPERDQLNEILERHNQTKPEPLLVDVAGSLNEAYAIHEPLAALLSQHRLLALARSPFPQRLGVLRSLAELDPESPHWDSDIQEMEQARFVEIESTCRTASAKGDLGVLKLLMNELTTTAWRVAPPAKLVRDLKLRGGQVKRTGARQQLEELAPQLHVAFSALDLALARELRDQWVDAVTAAQLPKNDELSEHVAPVLEWVADEDQREADEKSFQRAIADLERGLEDDTLSAAALRKLGDNVEKHSQPVPESLSNRFSNRLENLDLSELRHHRMRMIAIVVGFLLVAGSVGFIVYAGNRTRESIEILAAIDTLIVDQKFAEANKLFDQHKERATSEDWLAAKKKLADAEQKEHDREVEFAAAIDASNKASSQDAAAPHLKRARELAQTAEEKVAVSKLEGDWRSAHDAEVAKRENEFRNLIRSATTGLQSLDELLTGNGSDEDVASAVSNVSRELVTLNAQKAAVAASLASQATLLETRLNAARKTHADMKRRVQLLARLTNASHISGIDSASFNKSDEFFETLREYASVFPDDARATGFKTAAESDAAKLIHAKRRLANSWQPQLWPSVSDRVEQRLQECQAFLKTHPRCPDREVFTKYESVLKSIRRRDQSDDMTDESVKELEITLFSTPLIASGHAVILKDGKTYYLPEPKTFDSAAPVSFKLISGYQGQTKALGKALKLSDLVQPRTVAPPQAEIATRVVKEVRKLKNEDWDQYHRDLAKQLLTTNSIDAFLRYFLIVRTLQNASLGNALLAEQLAKPLTALEKHRIDLSVSWMDPGDEAANRARESATEALSDLKPEQLDEAWEQSEKQKQALGKLVQAQPMAVGWLDRESDRGWKIRTVWMPDRDFGLYVAMKIGESDDFLSWRRIGNATPRQLEINAGREIPVVDGLLVFAFEPSDAPITSD
jgi:hypothetical protein